ncbi:MAG: Hpt domain-containing protein [Spirochaetes bacterium]|nr:Hpt domain-containing protein [Spirochaetota bacterium]
MLIGIPGIDEETFKDLLDGNKELFISLVNSFVNKTPSTISKLTPISKETLPEYAKNIHGLKGACANICAQEAKKMAFNLEQKSKTGDLDGVLTENEKFLKYMEELIGNLEKWLKNHQ